MAGRMAKDITVIYDSDRTSFLMYSDSKDVVVRKSFEPFDLFMALLKKEPKGGYRMKRKTMIGLMAILMLAGMVVPAKATQVTSSSDQNSTDRETLLMEMPYEALPEENFEFDEESRTITAYTGTAVDVIIPRTIGGVPVENISYNAFECARNYVDSDMATNQKEGDWLPMRCLILPETLKSVADSTFTNCHDLETVICYAPLESTNKSVFQECKGLKTVIFVNGVRQMDNYLFNFCKNLETVWCKNQVDRIGIQTFGVTPMERLCVNAKDIDINAFSGNEAMKEIHIRSGVEHLALSAFAMLPAIETICLEGIDPNVMETNWVNLQNSELTILVPEDTTDEQMEAIGKKFLSSLIITDLSQVKRGTCSMPDDPMPDITEILSAYGM